MHDEAAAALNLVLLSGRGAECRHHYELVWGELVHSSGAGVDDWVGAEGAGQSRV
ncbi:hypothetical protein [Rhodococcus artemisiae]|uniref:hypothetical protein n=1 Tax=Rhodococcus artemisiae TaxID=714159 RepID=UPI0038B58DA2